MKRFRILLILAGSLCGCGAPTIATKPACGLVFNKSLPESYGSCTVHGDPGATKRIPAQQLFDQGYVCQSAADYVEFMEWKNDVQDFLHRRCGQ